MIIYNCYHFLCSHKFITFIKVLLIESEAFNLKYKTIQLILGDNRVSCKIRKPVINDCLFSGYQIWTSYKDFLRTVVYAITTRGQSFDALRTLEASLHQLDADLLNLLENPPPNSLERQAVQKSSSDGLLVKGRPSKQYFTEDFIREALIISELFKLKETRSVELLAAAESEISYHPEQPRGLVAVELYYTSRFCLIKGVKELACARSGRTWTLPGLEPNLVTTVTNYIQKLIDNGLVKKIIQQISDMDEEKELAKLEKERALGDACHRHRIISLFRSIKLCLSEVLFSLAVQQPLELEDTTAIINYLKTLKSSSLSLDVTEMTILLALLSSLDPKPTEEGIKHPAVDNQNFLRTIHNLIMTSKWENSKIRAVNQLSWAVALRTLSEYVNHDICEEDENVLDIAIHADAFEFLHKGIVNNERFHTLSDGFFVRHVHNLLTNAISLFPLKIKELRNTGDESARMAASQVAQGAQPSTDLPRHFEQLMSLLASVYGKDPMKQELAKHFWVQDPEEKECSHHKHQSLMKFVKLSGDMLPSTMYINYVKMLTGLATGPTCAEQACFLLESNGTAVRGSGVSFAHFFATFEQYWRALHTPDARFQQRSTPIGSRTISGQELEGLEAVLDLLAVLWKFAGTKSSQLLLQYCSGPGATPVHVMLALVGCSMPIALKARIVKTISCLCFEPDMANVIWMGLSHFQVLTHIKQELGQAESRNEKYPLTKAFLQLLSALCSHQLPNDRDLTAYATYLRQDVLQHVHNRAYSDANERWEICEVGMDVLRKFLTSMKPIDLVKVSDEHPSVQLTVHMLRDSSLFRSVMQLLHEAVTILDKYEFRKSTCLEDALLKALKVIEYVLRMQDEIIQSYRNSQSSILMDRLDQLLLGVNPKTGKADYLLVICRIIPQCDSLLSHAQRAINVLTLLCKYHNVHSDLVRNLQSDNINRRKLQSAFVRILEEDACIEWKEPEEDEGETMAAAQSSLMNLLLSTVRSATPNLTQLLLDFDIQNGVSKSNIEQAGMRGSIRTCLHSLVSKLEEEVANEAILFATRPMLACMYYEFMYELCTNMDTCTPTTRFLRLNHDFFNRQLQCLPFPKPDDSVKEVLKCEAWLMRMIALEMRILSANEHRSHLTELINELLRHTIQNFDETSFHQSIVGSKKRKLLAILDEIEMNSEDVLPEDDVPNIRVLDRSVVEEVIKNREVIDEDTSIIDLSTLQDGLLRTVDKSRQADATLEANEIQKYLKKRNDKHEWLSARMALLSAWQQIVEILMTSCPDEMWSSFTRHETSIEMLETLLRKSETCDAKLNGSVSATCLVLTSVIRHAFVKEAKSDTFIPSLLNITSLLIRKFVKTRTSKQIIRANIYGSLLHLVQVADRQWKSFSRDFILLFNENAENLLHTISSDACDGHRVCKLLALSILDEILILDRTSVCLSFLSTNGFINHLVEVINIDDLAELLAPKSVGAFGLKGLYVYESQMALLIRLVSTNSSSALSVLQAGIMEKFADGELLDARPQEDDNENIGTMNVTAIAIYRRILMPILRLCLGSLTMLGLCNSLATQHVLNFLLAHSDLIAFILRSHPHTEEQLKEICLVTDVVARCVCVPVDALIDETVNPVSVNHAKRLQQLVLLLLAGVCSSKETPKCCVKDCLKLRIAANVMTLCRALSCEYIVLTPSLTDAVGGSSFTSQLLESGKKAPELGLVVRCLKERTSQLLTVLDRKRNSERKCGRVSELSSEELKELSNSAVSAEQRYEAAASKLENLVKIDEQQAAILANIIENSLLVVWKHLDYYLASIKPKQTVTAAFNQGRMRKLQGRSLKFAFNK